MTMKVRVILAAMIVAMTLASVGCGHYVCGITKGATTCGNSGDNNKGSGNNNTGDAYLYQAKRTGRNRVCSVVETEGNTEPKC